MATHSYLTYSSYCHFVCIVEEDTAKEMEFLAVNLWKDENGKIKLNNFFPSSLLHLILYDDGYQLNKNEIFVSTLLTMSCFIFDEPS